MTESSGPPTNAQLKADGVRCSRRVHDGGRSVTMHQCMNPANGPDGLCGVHRQADARRGEAERKADERRAESDRLHAEALAAIDALAIAGVEARPEYVHGYTGELVVRLTSVDRLVELVALGHQEWAERLQDQLGRAEAMTDASGDYR